MISSILLIFVTVAILNYAVKRYLRRTISRNILVVAKTRCGKTNFMQKLTINNFFRDIVRTGWVSSIELTPTREAEIQFHYPQTLERFDDLIEDFKLKTIEDTDSINENEYGEEKRIQRLIATDDVSGLADP